MHLDLGPDLEPRRDARVGGRDQLAGWVIVALLLAGLLLAPVLGPASMPNEDNVVAEAVRR